MSNYLYSMGANRQGEGANQPGGEQARGRISQGANVLGGESARHKGRIIQAQGAN